MKRKLDAIKRKAEKLLEEVCGVGIINPHPALESAEESLKEVLQHIFVVSLAHEGEAYADP